MADVDPLDPHREERLAAREQAYIDGVAEWHARDNDENLDHLETAAIVECDLCNDAGYRHSTNRICDHIDRTETASRGRALVQAELDKIRNRKFNQARGGAA